MKKPDIKIIIPKPCSVDFDATPYRSSYSVLNTVKTFFISTKQEKSLIV